MAEEQKQSVPQQSAPKQDDADEVLVRQSDGTFRMMKVSSSGGATALPQKPAPQSPPVPSEALAKEGPLPRRQEEPRPKTAPQPSATPPALGGALLDEEEKKELATFAKVGSTTERKTEDDQHRVRAAHVIQQAGVILADESLRNRLTMALLARLKEIRDDVETRETLTRRIDRGGVGLNDNDANRLLAALKAKVSVTPPPPPPPPPLRVPPPTAKLVPPVRPPASLPSGASAKEGPAPRPMPPPKPPSPPPQPPQQPKPRPQSTVQNLQPSTFNLQPSSPPPPPLPSVAPQGAKEGPPRKPRVQDVSFTPTLRGPVGELKMEVAEWRRIGASFADRAAKVEEKLALLQEESYVERLAGIQAWRESGVVRLYREIADEALTTSRRVEEVLQERERSGQPTFSKDEFTSIAQLNTRLRF